MEEEYEVNLTDYLAVLWKQKWVVIITFLVAVITAIAISYSLPRQYQVETALLIFPPLAQDVGGQVTGTVYSPETYRRLALAGDLLQGAIGRAYPRGDGPTPAGLRGQMTVEVEQGTARDFPGRFPLLLRVAFTGSNREDLVSMAQAWTRAFIEKNTALFLDRTAQSLESVSQTFTEVERDLLAKQDALKVFQQQSLEPLLVAELASLERSYQTYLSDLAARRQALAAAEANVVALREALDQEPPHFTLERRPSEEAVWQFLGTRPSPRDLVTYSALTVQDQVLNHTYVVLRTSLAQAAAARASLEGEVAFLEGEVTTTRQLIEVKLARLVEAQVGRTQREQEIAVIQDTYDRVARSLQDARIARAETAEPIRAVEAPVLPTEPIGPNKRMNVAVAGVLGLFLGVLLAFVVHWLRAGPGQRRSADPSAGSPGQPERQ